MSRIESCHTNLLYLQFVLTNFAIYLWLKVKSLSLLIKFYFYDIFGSFGMENLAKVMRFLPSKGNKYCQQKCFGQFSLLHGHTVTCAHKTQCSLGITEILYAD